MYGILLQHLFLCYSSCVLSIMGFLFGWCEYLFVGELNIEYFTRQIFQNSFLSGEVLHGSLQGRPSVAT